MFGCFSEFWVKMLNCHENNVTMQIKKEDLCVILGPEDECEQMHTQCLVVVIQDLRISTDLTLTLPVFPTRSL